MLIFRGVKDPTPQKNCLQPLVPCQLLAVGQTDGTPKVDEWRIIYITKNRTNYMGVSKNQGKTPKMDGENNGNPY